MTLIRIVLLAAFGLCTAAAMAQNPCSSAADNTCSRACNGAPEENMADCLCDCLVEKSTELATAECYEEALEKLRAVAKLCPEKDAYARIEKIYESYRLWVYRDGKFALTTSLGKVLTPFQFENPKSFRQGMGQAEMNGRTYLVGPEGNILGPKTGFDWFFPFVEDTYFGQLDTTFCLLKKKGAAIPLLLESNPGAPVGSVRRFCDYCPDGDLPLRLLDLGADCGYQKMAFLPSGALMAAKDGYWGVVDTTGAVLHPFRYNQIIPVSGNPSRAVVAYKRKWGLIDSRRGRVLTPPRYDDRMIFVDSLAEVRKGGRYGLLDVAGKEVIPTAYTSIRRLAAANGAQAQKDSPTPYFLVKSADNLLGVFDRRGREVIPPRYEAVSWLSEEVAAPAKEDRAYSPRGIFFVRLYGSWGVIDQQGQEVIPPDNEEIRVFQPGRLFRVKRNGRWGLVDWQGKTVLPCRYAAIGEVEKGLATVILPERTIGLIDTSGSIRIPPAYRRIEPLNSRYAAILVGSKYSFYDLETGKEVVAPRFESIRLLSDKPRLLFIIEQDGKQGVINGNGKKVIDPDYAEIKTFFGQTTRFWARQENRWGCLDGREKTIIDFQYEFLDQGVYYFKENQYPAHYLQVRKDGKWGVLDATGAEIIAPRFDRLEQVRDTLGGDTLTLFGGFQNGRWGVLDAAGNPVLPFEYDDIGNPEKGVFTVEQGRKKGLVDWRGNVLAPPVYTSFKVLEEGAAIAEKRGQFFWLTADGHPAITLLPLYDELRRMSADRFWLRDPNRPGLVDAAGRRLQALDFEEARVVSASRAWLRIDRRWGLFDEEGRELLPPRYDQVGDFRDNLAWVMADGKWGVVDASGRERFPPQLILNERRDFSADKAWVRSGSNWQAIAANGQVLFSIVCDRVMDFHREAAWVRQGEKWGLINAKGLWLAEPEFETVLPFHSGVAWGRQAGRWRLVNVNADRLGAGDYAEVQDFSEGLAWVKKTSGDKWGLIDTSGQVVLPPRYDDATAFIDGQAMVKNGGPFLWRALTTSTKEEEIINNAGDTTDSRPIRLGIVDRTGAERIYGEYERLGFAIDGVAQVQQSGKSGIVTFSGQRFDFPEFVLILYQGDGIVWGVKNEKWQMVDTANQELIPGMLFEDFLSINPGLDHLEKPEEHYSFSIEGRSVMYLPRYHVINELDVVKDEAGRAGIVDNRLKKMVTPCILDGYRRLTDDLVLLKRNDEFGLLFTGSAPGSYIPPLYDDIEWPRPESELVIVRRGDKWGWVDRDGQVVISPEFDAVQPFDENGRAWVYLAGRRFQINREGRMVWTADQKFAKKTLRF